MNASHPELEDLAGLLDEPHGGPAEPGLAAHVAGCPRCQADLRALRTVQQTLRALPAIPMPDSVAARLEFAVRAGTGEPDSEPKRALPAESSVRPRPRAAWQLPHLSAAASVAVLLIIALGTGIAVMATRGGSSNGKTSTSSAAGASAATDTSTVVTASGADYQQATIRSQVAALVVERVPGSTTRFSGLQPLAGHAAAGKAAVPSATASSAASAGGFAAASPQAPQTLTADSAVAPARTAPGGPLADPAALQACVRALNGGTPIQPILVDYARFDGRPATVIVLPSTQSRAKLAVWVELDGSDCSTKGETAYYGSLSATP